MEINALKQLINSNKIADENENKKYDLDVLVTTVAKKPIHQTGGTNAVGCQGTNGCDQTNYCNQSAECCYSVCSSC